MSTICTGCQLSSLIFLIACAACFGVVAEKNRSAPESLILRICESMVGSVGFVGGFGHHHARGLVAETGLDAVEVVLAEVVVLIEHADLGVRVVLDDVLAVDAALDEVVRVEAHRPREVLGIGEPRRAGRCEQLRHFLAVEIFLHGGVHRRADDLEGEQHLVALDQLADLLDRFRRRIGVVILDQVDLAAVHAALIVDHLEIGSLRLADGGVSRRRSAEGHGLADLDLGIGRAGVVFLLREGRRSGERNRERGPRGQLEKAVPHVVCVPQLCGFVRPGYSMLHCKAMRVEGA